MVVGVGKFGIISASECHIGGRQVVFSPITIHPSVSNKFSRVRKKVEYSAGSEDRCSRKLVSPDYVSP